MLNEQQRRIHEQAIVLTRRHRELEREIINILRAVERLAVFRALGYTSLFVYSVRALGLSESVAYAFIQVARKSATTPELAAMIDSGELTVAKASRFCGALTPENTARLLAFARTHSSREVEREAHRASGRGAMGWRKLEVSLATLKLLKRVQDLRPPAAAKDSTKDFSKDPERLAADEALQRALNDYLLRHDPVEKAKRALKKSERSESSPSDSRVSAEGPESMGSAVLPESQVSKRSVEARNKVGRLRHPLKARIAHAVNLRDQGQCMFIDDSGQRCEARRWLHVHHIQAHSRGGTNDLSNLATLCSQHHAQVHQLGFAIDGQLNRIREPTNQYDAVWRRAATSLRGRRKGPGTKSHATRFHK